MTSRRDFLLTSAAAFFARTAEKKLQGIFPIMQTPFTEANALDTAVLAKEVKFLDGCGVHGVVWPQLASEWSELSPDERFAGAEAIMSAAKGLRTAVVLGVQGPDIDAAVHYAQRAEKLGPDAIIALPPRDRLADYYRAIGKACTRPLFIQTVGNISVDAVLQMAKDVPTLRFVKDEAGHTLSRISEFQRKDPSIAVFTGAHGKTLLDEMSRGSSGSMPASPFADLYVRVWDQWHAGRHEQAMETFSRVALLVNEVSAYGLPSVKYILSLRGVFPNWRCRGRSADAHFDAAAERAVKESWEFARKLLRG
jgi:4-hydroxy-tetrahydrodipicolinate synthase